MWESLGHKRTSHRLVPGVSAGTEGSQKEARDREAEDRLVTGAEKLQYTSDGVQIHPWTPTFWPSERHKRLKGTGGHGDEENAKRTG